MKGGIRERSKGNYSYYFKYKDETGKWKQKSKGGFKTKKEAQSALRKAIIDFENQGFMQKESDYTLDQFKDYWLENVALNKLRYNTLQGYLSNYKNHIQPELGGLKLSKITPVILQIFFNNKLKTVGSDVFALTKAVLGNMMSFATKQKIIPHNPMSGVEIINPEKNDHERDLVTIEDVKFLLEKTKGTHNYFPMLISLNTGLRRGEVLGLTWDNIDFETGTITVNKQLVKQVGKEPKIAPTKTKSSNRKLLAPRSLLEELASLKEEQVKRRSFYKEHYYDKYAFVCCTEDGYPISPPCLSGAINYLSKKYNIPIKFHELRHLHATMLLEADVHAKVIQERLGHSTLDTTMNVYSHVSLALERDSIGKFEKIFDTK